jgi:hypothetical protein
LDLNGCLWGWGKYEYIKQDNARNVFSPIRIFPQEKKVKKISFMDERIVVEIEERIKVQDQEPIMMNVSITNNISARNSLIPIKPTSSKKREEEESKNYKIMKYFICKKN